MDLKHLRFFVAVVDRGSLNAAAKSLGIAQPALSRRIQDLEASLGCSLLVRSVRGVSPTEAGRILHREAGLILDGVARAKRLVRSVAQGQDRQFRLGMVRSARKYDFVHRALAKLATRQPDTKVWSTVAASPQLAADLGQGLLDASLIYENRVDTALLAERLVHRERYLLAVHPNHHLSRPGPIALSELAGEEFVWLPRGEGANVHDPVLDHCRARGLDPVISQTARTHSELIDIVSTSGGLCITPSSSAITIPNQLLAFRSIPDFTLELDLYLSWQLDLQSAPFSQALAIIHQAIDEHRSDIEAGRVKWAYLDGAAQARTS